MHEVETEERYEATFNAETAFIPVILRHAASFARRLDSQRIDELLIVVRELASNAIIHGSKSDGTKMVRLSITFEGDRFTVDVDDEGEGFDYESLDLRLPDDPFSLSRRGLIIVHELAEELVFLGQGNRARAIVHADDDQERGERDYGVAAVAVGQKYQEEACISLMARN